MQPDESGTLRAEQSLPSQPWFVAHQGHRVTDCQLSVTLSREAAPALPFYYSLHCIISFLPTPSPFSLHIAHALDLLVKSIMVT